MSERLSTRVNQIEKIKYIREEESNLVFLALIFLSFFSFCNLLGHLLWTGSCVTIRMQAAKELAVAE